MITDPLVGFCKMVITIMSPVLIVDTAKTSTLNGWFTEGWIVGVPATIGEAILTTS
jgi:hypothetical protein